MNFTIIKKSGMDNKALDHYEFIGLAQIDKTAEPDRNDNYHDDEIDSFYDGWGDLCKGEDGKLYGVVFSLNTHKPYVWCEVKRMLRDKDFNILFGAALEEHEKDRFVAEWSMSEVFGEIADLTDDEFVENGEICSRIWDAAHMTIKDILEKYNMTQAQLSERFYIPRRTVEDWARGLRTPPDYVRLMIMRELKSR